MIKESLVDYETALLLNRHSFEGEYHYEFHLSGTCLVSKEEGEIYSDIALPAPSISLVMKWLREVHKNIILVNFYRQDRFSYDVLLDGECGDNYILHSGLFEHFKNYEEACEAAIKHCLKNII